MAERTYDMAALAASDDPADRKLYEQIIREQGTPEGLNMIGANISGPRSPDKALPTYQKHSFTGSGIRISEPNSGRRMFTTNPYENPGDYSDLAGYHEDRREEE